MFRRLGYSGRTTTGDQSKVASNAVRKRRQQSNASSVGTRKWCWIKVAGLACVKLLEEEGLDGQDRSTGDKWVTLAQRVDTARYLALGSIGTLRYWNWLLA